MTRDNDRRPGLDKGGRVRKLKGPTTDQDFEIFEKLCSIQCTAVEIASYMGCSVESLRVRLMERYGMGTKACIDKFRSDGLVSLRRAQFSKALSGNTSMLIWLGKQVLDQRDKPAVEHEGQESKIAGMANQEVVHGLEKRIERIQRRRKKKSTPELGASGSGSSEEGSS